MFNPEGGAVQKFDTEDGEVVFIDMSQIEGQKEHVHNYEEEPDPDYPGRTYMTCSICGFGLIKVN